MLYIIRELLNFEPKGKRTDVTVAMEYLMKVITKRSITFVISDFLDTRDFSRPLLVAARKHDLVGLRLYDSRMASLPDVGLLKIVDAETGHETIHRHVQPCRTPTATSLVAHRGTTSRTHCSARMVLTMLPSQRMLTM